MDPIRLNIVDDYDKIKEPGDAQFYSYKETQHAGLHFICPKCRALLGIEFLSKWTWNDQTLSATPSILHTPPHGCGWHGYITNGQFITV